MVIKNIASLKRLYGVIGCLRELNENVLLPNADVILCCMDFKLKHVLGNLLDSDYTSLFQGEGFSKVKNGLKDDKNIEITFLNEHYHKFRR